MPVIVYVDETGDHTLELVDKDFPVFVLVLLICDTEKYTGQIVPAFYRLKMDYFGHEGVIMHSRDIRKAQGDFGFLTDPEKRPPFYSRINDIMEQSDYTLIAAAIRKQIHKERYGVNARNPYDLAFTFALERLLPLLEGLGQTEVRLVAEARGKREDEELQLAFLRVVNNGTYYIDGSRFRRIQFRLEFIFAAAGLASQVQVFIEFFPRDLLILYPLLNGLKIKSATKANRT